MIILVWLIGTLMAGIVGAVIAFMIFMFTTVVGLMLLAGLVVVVVGCIAEALVPTRGEDENDGEDS